MAPDPTYQRIVAHFITFNGAKLHEEEAIQVMMEPEFWDYFASRYQDGVRNPLVKETMRRALDEETKAFPLEEQRLKGSVTNFRALYADVADGAKFEFLRNWFCGEYHDEDEEMDEVEDGVEAMSVEEEAEMENGNSKAQVLIGFEAGLRRLERDAAAVGGAGSKGNENFSAEVEMGRVWTESDSEAEREEAERKKQAEKKQNE